MKPQTTRPWDRANDPQGQRKTHTSTLSRRSDWRNSTVVAEAAAGG